MPRQWERRETACAEESKGACVEPLPSGGSASFRPCLGLWPAPLSQAITGSTARVSRVGGCVDGTRQVGTSPLRLPAQTHSPGLTAAQTAGKPQQRGVLLCP
ncbi:hypothetical protein MJG53_017066 [Ovis ammon polii x Ovis aries]|uniref:Uncharacterized protein n=1 Tax=Ovis ammon polii x Ovis aries TaxID=2918886 RepID=A0ACB9UAC6_9CETA|nr:hypothetical protein MJG53_017066 [Ovis ammon polii x Ovis aries]